METGKIQTKKKFSWTSLKDTNKFYGEFPPKMKSVFMVTSCFHDIDKIKTQMYNIVAASLGEDRNREVCW